MIAGPEPAPTGKRHSAARHRFDIDDLVLLYKAVTPVPRVVFQVLKSREFRAIRERSRSDSDAETSEASKRGKQASVCAQTPQNAGPIWYDVRTSEIPQAFPHPSLISLDFAPDWLAAVGKNRGVP